MSIQTNKLPDNPQIEVIKSGKTGLFTNYIYSIIFTVTLSGLIYVLILYVFKNYVVKTIVSMILLIPSTESVVVHVIQYLSQSLDSFVEILPSEAVVFCP